MKIFIDLDDVLFDTATFSIELKDVFAMCGVDADLFKKTYEKSREHKTIHIYSYTQHLIILERDHGFDPVPIQRAVEKFLGDTKKFIFDDVEDFLGSLQRQGHSLYLVSFGSLSIQRGKVQGSKLLRYFDEILIGEINKGKIIKAFLGNNDGSKSMFIEDRVRHIDNVKECCPQIQTILVRRPKGRYHDKRTSACDFIVVSLDEAKEIINELS